MQACVSLVTRPCRSAMPICHAEVRLGCPSRRTSRSSGRQSAQTQTGGRASPRLCVSAIRTGTLCPATFVLFLGVLGGFDSGWIGWFHCAPPTTISRMKRFITTFPSNVVNCFKGRMLIWHALAILLTVVLVQSGLDWWFFQETHTPELRRWLFPAVRVGFYLPIWLPIILFLVGFIMSNSRIVRSGWALLQSELIGLFISSAYKAVTGRAHPLHIVDRDISHVFQFGFMRGGVFWGWPSSHTTIAFGMAFTVITLFPKWRWLSAAVILYALYVGLGVSMTIHWFSDFAAGVIIGSVIGVIVGRCFSTETRAIS